MLALGLTGLGAGSFNSIINDFGVTLGGDFLNSGDRCAADRAFDARRMTGFRAGGGLFSNINERMTGCIKHFGFGLVADRAGVGLDTGIFTGRSGRDLALIPLVSRCGNFLHAGESLAADRAFFAGFMTSLGAGSGLFSNLNGSMAGSNDCFGFGLVADRAGVGLDTGSFTGRSGRDLALIPTVSIRRNLSLRNDDCVADGAVFTLSLAGCGAGGFNCRVGDLGVSLRGNFLLCNKNLVADGAVLALCLAGFGAGRFDCRVDDLGVSLRGNFLLCNDDRVADGAMLALGLAGFGAGGFNCRVDDLGVSLRGYFLHAGESRAADRALRAGFVSGLGAGCGLLGNFNGSMTGSRNNLTVSDLLTAVRAVGIAGIAILGASGGFRVADLGVLM